MEEIIKKDNNTITVTKTMPVAFDLSYDYLIEQRARIVEQKEKDNAQRDLEIAEIDGILK